MKTTVRSALIASTFLAAMPAMAQEQAPQQGEAATDSGFQDIIVTAQRRSERLERTPVAVAVIDSDTLQSKAITTEADLQSTVPGLTIRGTANSNQLNYSIRGQTIDAYSSSRPAVLPYFNEVQASSAGASAFYDLQSVQVLKGPQGTLFGRNSTGGAVLFTSATPKNELGGYLTGRIGNFDFRSIEAALNLPVVEDRMLLRLAGFADHRDGFQRDIYNGQRLGTVERQAARASLTIKPAAGLENNFVIDYLHSGGSNTVPVAYNAYAPGGTPSAIPSSSLFSPDLDAAFGPGSWAAYLALHPRADPNGLLSYVADQAARGPYKVAVSVFPKHRGRNLTITNTTSYDVSDTLTVKNILGFVNSRSLDFLDSDGTSYDIQGSGATGSLVKNRFFSEEFQIVGKAFADQLNYVTGVYYAKERNEYFSATAILDLTPFIPVTLQQNNSRQNSEAIAGYAQGTFDLSGMTGVEGLGITGGIRFTHEKVDSVQLPGSSYYQFSLVNPDAVDFLEAKFNKLSWQFGLQDQVNSSLLLYAVTRRSFRSGGFNNVAAPFPGTAADGGAGFDAETTTDVELGAKFQGRVGGMPVRLNADVYSQWVKKVQRTVYTVIPSTGSIAVLTVNIPEARIQGAELEAAITPASWLNIGANVAYTNAKFTKNRSVLFGNATDFGPYPDTPEWSGTVFAEVSGPLPDDLGTLSLRGDVYAQTKTYFSSLDNTINPGTRLPGYNTVNLRLGLDDIKGTGLSLALTAKNLTDETYFIGGFPTGNLLGMNSRLPGDRRTIFGEIRFKW